MMKKIAALVSGGGTNLQAIIDAQKSGVIKSGSLEFIISSKSGAFALTRAKDNGIESAVLEPESFADRAAYTAAICEALKARGIDLVVLAGFMYILDGLIVREFSNRIINVHPALIPSFSGRGYYGLRVHRAALEKGVKLTGATVHFVNEETDGGPIILQKAVEVLEDDTPETLQKRVMEQAEWDILPRAVELFCAGRLSAEGSLVRIRPD